MADISDVEQAIADNVTAVLYPSGSSQASIIGVLCRIYRGWPSPAALNSDLSNDAVNVTITTDNDSGRTTTRYLPRWTTTTTRSGVALTTTGQRIQVAGSPAVGDVVGALIDGATFVYRVKDGDTPGLVASSLGQIIQSARPTSVQGLNITIPGAHVIKVRAVRDGFASFEGRRQEKNLRVICWCPNPILRDNTAGTIDAAMSRAAFLQLPDATRARIIYFNTASYDQAQNALLYRRDLIYTVEYPTVIGYSQPSMLFGDANLNGTSFYG